MRFLAVTILTTVTCCCALGGEDIDRLILEFARDIRGFDWGRVESVDRDLLVKRLRTLLTGESTNVLGGYGIGSRTAALMLVGIGDEAIVRETVQNYHEMRRGVLHLADIVECGQAIGIAYLAPDLVSEQYLVSQSTRPDGGAVTERNDGKRLTTALEIATLAKNSRQFAPAVRESAKAAVARLKAADAASREQFLQAVTNWWLTNESKLTNHDFAEVVPFQLSDAYAVRTSGQSQDVAAKTAVSAPPNDAGTDKANQPRSVRWWRWALGAALLVFVAIAVLWQVRTKLPGRTTKQDRPNAV